MLLFLSLLLAVGAILFGVDNALMQVPYLPVALVAALIIAYAQLQSSLTLALAKEERKGFPFALPQTLIDKKLRIASILVAVGGLLSLRLPLYFSESPDAIRWATAALWVLSVGAALEGLWLFWQRSIELLDPSQRINQAYEIAKASNNSGLAADCGAIEILVDLYASAIHNNRLFLAGQIVDGLHLELIRYMRSCERTPLEISSDQLFSQQNYYIQSLVEQCQKLALIAHNRGEKILFSRTLLLHGKITAELIKHAQLARLTLKYLPQLSHLGLQSGWKGSVEKIQLMLVHLIRELMNRGSGETLSLFTEIVECMREIARIQHRNDRDQPVVFIKEPFLMILEAIERSSNIDGSTLKTYREPVEDALSELNHLEMILDKIPEFPGSPAADSRESIDETAAEEERQP